MKDSASKSRLSDEGVRKKEPSVSKIESKELSESTMKATLPKAKINTLGTVKIKTMRLKNAKSINLKKKPAESAGKSPIMRKKIIDNSLVVKGSPKTELTKKESSTDKEKQVFTKTADLTLTDYEIDIAAIAICKVPDKVETKKESPKVKVKKVPSEILVSDLGSSNKLEKKNSAQKGDIKKDSKKTQEKQPAEHSETEKVLSNKLEIVPVKKVRRRRLSLKEEKLLHDSKKAEQKPPLTSDKPTVSKEDPKVPVKSAVTILAGEDDKPVKKSRDRKQSFKARELLIQSIAKSNSHANQVKDNASSTKVAKHTVAVEPIPVKTKTDNPKVNSTRSPEGKEPTEAASMIKFTYEKPLIDSVTPSQEIMLDPAPVLADGLKSPGKHKPIVALPETSEIEQGMPERAMEMDIEGQLQVLEDGATEAGEKDATGSKDASATPGKTDTPEGFQPGARMEALEISSNKWYGVKVVEVDWAENEVLIHFEKWSQRFDEWIQMDSSRLRPCEPRETPNEKLYHVGETVMATWMNSQKYPAKVKKMLNNDFLEVLFFDGFTKTMRTNKIAKCVGNEGLEPILPPPPPTLMSKLERRERKRKIQSVAELFHTKRKKHKTKKPNDLSIESKPDFTTGVEDTVSKKKHKYTDLTNISDNEGEKTYIDLNTSFTQEEKETELPKPKDGNEILIPAKRPYKRKKLLNAVTELSSPESGSAKEGIFPFKGRKHNEAIGADYDNWEPDGEEAYVVETADGLRRSLVVKDDRLPAGWAKHTIQRRSGNSAGKWDVFLVSPGGRRFRSRKEMQVYFSDIGEEYRPELFDFTLRCNMRRKCEDTVYVKPSTGRRTKHLTLRKHKPTLKLASSMILDGAEPDDFGGAMDTPQRKYKIAKLAKGEAGSAVPEAEPVLPAIPVPEGSVLIGNLQVVVDPAGAYICPSEGCSKHFRRENLLQMHIKHYHPELSAFAGTTPNVADLAYARTVGAPVEDMALSGEYFERLHRVEVAKKLRLSTVSLSPPGVEKKPVDKKAGKTNDSTSSELPSPDRPSPATPDAFTRPATSTPLRDLLRKDALLTPTAGALGPARELPKAGVTAGIKTLLPIVRSAAKAPAKDAIAGGDTSDSWTNYPPSPSDVSVPSPDGVFHKLKRKRRLSDAYMDGIRKRKHGSAKLRLDDSNDAAFSLGSDENSFLPPTPLRIAPGSMKKKNPLLSASLSRPLPDYRGVGSPELLGLRPSSNLLGSSSAEPTMTEEQLNKRDIINCTCGAMEEDGLMIQCDLCLCWQHGYCNNIERENEVPDKYVCYICQHPARERMSTHYLHDQDWLNEGVLPSLSERSRADPVVANRTVLLRKSHDLAAGLLQLQNTIKSLRVKVNVANTHDHPKLYLWAKPWEKSIEPKLENSCIESNLLNHEQGSAMTPSEKDGNDLAPSKIEGSNGQFISDVGGETRSAAAVAGSNESSHGVPRGKEMPKITDDETSLAVVKEEPEDAGNLESECKTELESVNAIENAGTNDAKRDELVKVEEGPVEDVPKNAGESMDVDEVKEKPSLGEASDPLAAGDAKRGDGAKDLGGGAEGQTQQSTPLMEGVASTSSQVPLIESSLQSKQFNTDKTGADMDTTLLMQALTHGGPEPALTNGTDLSNGHLDPSQLLNFPISKMELLRFANSIADNFKAAAVVNHSHPCAPEPEKPIDPRECRLLLLDHIELKQREVKQQLEVLENQLAVLEAEDPEPPGEETLDFYPQTKQTVKMLLRDLNTLKKISEIN